jgi:hypothetical protein
MLLNFTGFRVEIENQSGIVPDDLNRYEPSWIDG